MAEVSGASSVVVSVAASAKHDDDVFGETIFEIHDAVSKGEAAVVLSIR